MAVNVLIPFNFGHEISIVTINLSGRAQISEATYAKTLICKWKYFQNNKLFPRRFGLRISESMLY